VGGRFFVGESRSFEGFTGKGFRNLSPLEASELDRLRIAVVSDAARERVDLEETRFVLTI